MKMVQADAKAPLRLAALGALSLTAACASRAPEGPDLNILYTQSAQYHLPDRNPVIVIPGILGSRLVDRESGQLVWGAFEPGAADPQTPEGARLLALPVDGERPLHELRDGVEPDGVLERLRVRLLGVPVAIRAYAGILATLGAGGYVDEGLSLAGVDYGGDHFTCFQFDYDWRRDNVENAKRLQAFIEEKRAYVRQVYKERYGIEDAEVKFDLVAHSMGGLLTRYFLRYGDADLPEGGPPPEVTWAGAEHVERVVLVGAPNAGSLEALTQLVEGLDVGRPLFPFYQPALLATFPSVFQLLPRARHGAAVWDEDQARRVQDLYDPALWERFGWGLAASDKRDREFLAAVLPDAHSDAARRREALALQARMLARAKAFHAALDRFAAPPEGLELFLVAGDSRPTPQTVSIDSRTGKLKVIATGPGDGTVLRASALLDERPGGDWEPTLVSPIDWASVMFVFSDHIGLTQDPAFSDNVLYWLLEDPRQD